MKKLAFAVSAVILSCFVTCTTNTAHEDGTSEKAHKNMENLKAVISMFETGDYSKAGDYIATDGVDHTGPTGEVKGLDNLKAMFAQMGSTMTNVKNEIKKELAAKIGKQLRRMPILQFFLDDTLEQVFKMEELFKKINENKGNE